MGLKYTGDMTEGTIWKELLLFSFPLLLGDLFQQLYNTVDGIVVGRFVGAHALGAVTSVAPAINMLIGFFVGLSSGASVVISQKFGAKDREGLGAAVHTAVTVSFLGSFVLAAIGILISPFMLKWMDTPPQIAPDALVYLRIYFGGIVGLMMYNIGAGILRAVGDSRRPLLFLIFSTVLNTALDILFVGVFHLGVAGVAYATILSQIISVILIMLLLFRTKAVYKLSARKLGIDWEILKKIFAIGLPAGLQMAIISFSNVFVQAYINHFGPGATSGWGLYIRLDSFIRLPVRTLGISITTFVGQNAGAERLDRIKRGVNVALLIAVGVTSVVSVLMWVFAPSLVLLFTPDPEVMRFGVGFIRLIVPFSFLACWNNVHAGALRGVGNSKVPMFIMIGSFVVFRQLYLLVVSSLAESIRLVALGYPLGWLVCSILMGICFNRSLGSRFPQRREAAPEA